MAFTRLAAALALFAAGAAAQQVLTMTTGKKLDVAPAYTFVSDVAGYLKVSNDVCEFDNALNQPTPNFAAAKKLYASGKNSKKSDGSIRTLKGLGTGDNSGEPFWDQYAKHFKSVTFVDDMVSKALDGVAPFKTTPLARREVARKGVSSNLIMAYLMHEMDEAAYKMGATPPEISDAKGAPHNVDEAFALYVGEKSECSPWGISNKRGTVFDTMDTCTASKANTAAVAAFNAALAAARKGDMKGFMAARAKVLSAFAVTSVQATIQYAEQMVANLAAKKPTDEYQAEAYAFFRAVEPLVAQASASSAAAIVKLLMPGSPVTATSAKQVTAALEKAYAGLGITKADVGTYNGGSYTAPAKC
ncbi:MAG: Low iron-inducible periplasmic protein-domain-containing protein [Monoraphidium minutum]|nr:MAG: Low iron-inducible periplasmic protein-domain-containing protein [Monoraphidium minutum]